MRKYVNKALSVFGYELRRLDYFKYFLHQLIDRGRQPCIVQIGAHDGVSFDDLFSVIVTQQCRALLVEPLQDAFQKLSSVYSLYPAVTLVRSAVHASKSEESLFRVKPEQEQILPLWVRGLSSFDESHLLRHGVPVEHIVSETIPCASLMKLIKDHRFLDANILQVDVEGYDGEVIRMIDFALFKPSLIKFESKNLAQLEFAAIKNLLANEGYRIYPLGEDTVAWRGI